MSDENIPMEVHLSEIERERRAARRQMQEDMRRIVKEEIDARIKPLETSIGELDNSGKGGTGLTGQIARTNARVDELFGLRNTGFGVLIALSITGGVLYLGIKSWVRSLAAGLPTP